MGKEQAISHSINETDPSKLAEGHYIKREQHGQVTERYKYVRFEFTDTVRQSGSHSLERPIIRNGLVEGVDIFLIKTPDSDNV